METEAFDLSAQRNLLSAQWEVGTVLLIHFPLLLTAS